MTEPDLNDLSKRLLCGVHEKAFSDATAGGQALGNAALRRGYTVFKTVLFLTLFFAVFAVFSWSRALAGSPLGIETAGYVYVSVPLKATQVQTERVALRVDLVGAGVKLLRFKMARHDGHLHLLSGSHRYDWRTKSDVLRHHGSHRRSGPEPEPHQGPQPTHAPGLTSADNSQYLSLLKSYQEKAFVVKRP